jgi:hypothetical protein
MRKAGIVLLCITMVVLFLGVGTSQAAIRNFIVSSSNDSYNSSHCSGQNPDLTLREAVQCPITGYTGRSITFDGDYTIGLTYLTPLVITSHTTINGEGHDVHINPYTGASLEIGTPNTEAYDIEIQQITFEVGSGLAAIKVVHARQNTASPPSYINAAIDIHHNTFAVGSFDQFNGVGIEVLTDDLHPAVRGIHIYFNRFVNGYTSDGNPIGVKVGDPEDDAIDPGDVEDIPVVLDHNNFQTSEGIRADFGRYVLAYNNNFALWSYHSVFMGGSGAPARIYLGFSTWYVPQAGTWTGADYVNDGRVESAASQKLFCPSGYPPSGFTCGGNTVIHENTPAFDPLDFGMDYTSGPYYTTNWITLASQIATAKNHECSDY